MELLLSWKIVQLGCSTHVGEQGGTIVTRLLSLEQLSRDLYWVYRPDTMAAIRGASAQNRGRVPTRAYATTSAYAECLHTLFSGATFKS